MVASEYSPITVFRDVKLGLSDHLDGHLADAGKTDAARRALRQIDVAGEMAALLDERPAIVDAHHDGATLIGDADQRAEWQGTVRRRHGVRIEPLAARGVAAGF